MFIDIISNLNSNNKQGFFFPSFFGNYSGTQKKINLNTSTLIYAMKKRTQGKDTLKQSD